MTTLHAFMTRPAGAIAVVLMALSASAQAATVQVTNSTGGAVTLSDFTSFANANNTGAAKVQLKPKDAADDVNLAIGGTKNFDIGADKSLTISWLNSKGVEVETSLKPTDFTIYPKYLAAMFDSNAPGSYAIALDYGAANANNLPALGTTSVLGAGGHIAGGAYDWVTFYDTSATDGDFSFSSSGAILNPVLSSGTEVTESFSYDISPVPEPEGFALALVGATLSLVRPKRKAQ